MSKRPNETSPESSNKRLESESVATAGEPPPGAYPVKTVMKTTTETTTEYMHVPPSCGVPVEGVAAAAAAATGIGPLQLPSLCGSSRLEIQFAAHIGSMLHECGLVSAPVSVESLSQWLLAGKAAMLTDMRFDLDLVGKDILLEYDHPRTHKAADVERDVAKTIKLVEAYPSSVVMRARIYNPVKLPAFSQANVSIVDVKTQAPSLAGPAVAKALSKYMDSPHKARLESYTAPKTHASTDMFVHELTMKIEPKYHDAVVSLRAILGGDGDENAIVRIINTHGLTARYDNLVTFVRRVRKPPYNITRVETILCGGIAAKLDDLCSIFSILDRLLSPPYNIKSLQTICNGGFCAKFDDESTLFAILDRLLAPPYNVKNLQTICKNGFCAKFNDEVALFAILDRLLAPPYNVKSLQTICNDGVTLTAKLLISYRSPRPAPKRNSAVLYYPLNAKTVPCGPSRAYRGIIRRAMILLNLRPINMSRVQKGEKVSIYVPLTQHSDSTARVHTYHVRSISCAARMAARLLRDLSHAGSRVPPAPTMSANGTPRTRDACLTRAAPPAQARAAARPLWWWCMWWWWWLTRLREPPEPEPACPSARKGRSAASALTIPGRRASRRPRREGVVAARSCARGVG